MSRYEYQTSYHHKRVKARKTRALAIASGVLVLFVAIFVIYDQVRGKLDNKQPESQATVSAVEGAVTNLFTTEYFQFQVDKKWVEIPEASTPTKFVYKSKNGPLVEHQLVIYVDDKPTANDAYTTRVYPVKLTSDGRLENVNGVSDHCKSGIKTGLKNEPEAVEYNGVKFICNAPGVNYRVFVGQVGGTTSLPLTRPNGQIKNYTIVYDDVRAYPSSNQIDAIVSTFRTR